MHFNTHTTTHMQLKESLSALQNTTPPHHLTLTRSPPLPRLRLLLCRAGAPLFRLLPIGLTLRRSPLGQLRLFRDGSPALMQSSSPMSSASESLYSTVSSLAGLLLFDCQHKGTYFIIQYKILSSRIQGINFTMTILNHRKN